MALPDYTPDNAQGRFNVLGGNPLIWWNSDMETYLVVYMVPDSNPPLPVYWEVPDEETIQSYFGPDVSVESDRHVTNAQLVSYGALGQGSSTEMPATDQDPLASWAEIYERQSKVRPYLRSPEVVGMIMGAAIEGRSVTQAELESTGWWQTHTEGEREWLIKAEADPLTAQQEMTSNWARVREDLKTAGIDDPPSDLVDFLAGKYTTGVWLENTLIEQISALSDPYSVHQMNSDTSAFMGGIDGIDTTRKEEDTVRNLLREWLGPQYGAWSDEQIAKKAGELRNDPDAQTVFEQQLGKQRIAMFPGYDDESLTYEDIAAPWRNFGYQQWGEEVDETDPVFSQILRTNDAIENGKILTREGLRRGVKKVTTDIQSQVSRATGGAVERSAY